MEKLPRFTSPIVYAVWSKNEQTRYNSTSGGAFSEFAENIISKGGIVAGAQYTDENYVEHAIISKTEDIEKLRQSKYLSSSIGDIYKEVKKNLDDKKLVGFCGSPCQVAGLYSFLENDYENLFTMDFICRGMNSPKAFKSWLNEIEVKENAKVRKVWFKYKKGGWKSSPTRTRLDFDNGKYKVYEYEKNLYMYGYLNSNLYIRPSCGDCKFKGLPRKSDITFADFWGIEKEFDDDKGTSMILVNSKKGKIYFEELKDKFEYYQQNLNKIVEANPMFFTSVSVPKNSSAFLRDLDNLKFSDCLKKYNGYPKGFLLLRNFKRKIKKILNKVRNRE